MLKHALKKTSNGFGSDYVNFWGHLNRLNNLLVIMNISMYFLTGLVAKGYFYTFFH